MGGDGQHDLLHQPGRGGAYEFNAHGGEHNQRYASGAVVPDGTPMPTYERDPELYAQATTWPGAKLPHTWVTRGGVRTSTLDLAGGGEFTLLTGIGGQAWSAAAATVCAERGLAHRVVVVGPGQRVEDPVRVVGRPARDRRRRAARGAAGPLRRRTSRPGPTDEAAATGWPGDVLDRALGWLGSGS